MENWNISILTIYREVAVTSEANNINLSRRVVDRENYDLLCRGRPGGMG